MGGIKIFQAMAGAEHGGAETFFTRLAIALHHAGAAQSIAIRPWPQRMRLLREAGIDVAGCRFLRHPAFIARRRMRRMVHSCRADVMLTWMNRATMLAPDVPIPHVARLGGFYDLKYYRHCDRLVANTKGIADYLIGAGWPADKVEVLRNFVPQAATHKPRSDMNAAPHFVSLGRLHRNKGFDILLDAVARIPDARLSIAGEGDEAGALKNHANDLGIAGRVRFLPWQDAPQDFIASGDFFVCPSRHEPFGNVIIEAFATGIPVISTSTDAAREYLTADDNALVVPCDDAESLADAMQNLAAAPRLASRIGAAGHKTYQRDFTEAKAVKAWLGFLEGIA